MKNIWRHQIWLFTTAFPPLKVFFLWCCKKKRKSVVIERFLCSQHCMRFSHHQFKIDNKFMPLKPLNLTQEFSQLRWVIWKRWSASEKSHWLFFFFFLIQIKSFIFWGERENWILMRILFSILQTLHRMLRAKEYRTITTTC